MADGETALPKRTCSIATLANDICRYFFACSELSNEIGMMESLWKVISEYQYFAIFCKSVQLLNQL